MDELNEILSEPSGSPEEEKELFEHHHIIVDRGQSQLRIDKFLVNRILNVSRSKVQNAADAGNILVNDKPVKSNYKVKPGDIISVVLPEPLRDTTVLAEDIPLNIIHEDDHILIINKKPGMVVHPAYANYTGTLLNALLWHFEHGSYNQPASGRPLLVHRIDKDTSGLLIVAKDELSQAKLAKQFFNHTTERAYNALVWGDFQEDNGTITGLLGRSSRDRKVMAVYPDGEHGKSAVTHYRVIERFRYITHLECRLETGRTHQIRAHMKHIGHPIFNDAPYGGDGILKGTSFSKYRQFITNCFTLMPRQALHAKTLGFIHPHTGKSIRFDSELPDDFSGVIQKWKTYTKAGDIGHDE